MTDIRTLFHDRVPGEPPTGSWAGQARARHRRARVRAGIAAGVLALVIGVPLGYAALIRPTEVALPAGSSSAPVQLPARDATEVCAAVREEASEFGFAPSSDTPRLRLGAVRAWLCGDDSGPDQGYPSGTRGPLDPLTQRVDEAVSWYLDAEPAPAEQACTDEYRLTFTVAFEYPDGALLPARGALHGCRIVTDGATGRLGGEEYLELLTRLWVEGRDADVAAEPEPCSSTGTIIVADPARAVSGTLCSIDHDGVTTASALTPEQAAEVGGSVASTSREADPAVLEFATQAASLELMDRAGDVFRLEALADGGFLFHDGERTLVWRPTGDLASSLADVGQPSPDKEPGPDDSLTPSATPS